MKRMPKKKKPISAEAIARMADQGKDVTRFFTGGRMMNPIQRANVDFTAEMLQKLDEEAAGLNISRPAVIKTSFAKAWTGDIPGGSLLERNPRASVVRSGPVERRQNRTSCL
jgi:hypothetical protein